MQIGDSVGIELEFPFASRRSITTPDGFKTMHDASSETGQFYIASSRVIVVDKDFVDSFPYPKFINVAEFGGELVSRVLNVRNEKDINDLFTAFRSVVLTNPTTNPKCSMHVHVNVTKDYPLYALKNLIRIITGMEKFLYTVSGFNTVNRGVTNDFLFQRPLGSPAYLKLSGNSYVPAYDTGLLLKTEDVTNFWYQLCNAEGKNKYNPARYSGISLPSIMQRGSVEFRYGNYLTDFKVLRAWVNMCRNIVKASFSISLGDIFDEERTIKTVETEDYIDIFGQILTDWLMMDLADIDLLMNLYVDLPKPLLTTDKHIISHITTDFTNTFGTPVPDKVVKGLGKLVTDNVVQGTYSRGDDEAKKLYSYLTDLQFKARSPLSESRGEYPHLNLVIDNKLLKKGSIEFDDGSRLLMDTSSSIYLKYVYVMGDVVLDEGVVPVRKGLTIKECVRAQDE